jgi:hypothetical protein
MQHATATQQQRFRGGELAHEPWQQLTGCAASLPCHAAAAVAPAELIRQAGRQASRATAKHTWRQQHPRLMLMPQRGARPMLAGRRWNPRSPGGRQHRQLLLLAQSSPKHSLASAAAGTRRQLLPRSAS